MTTSRIVLLVLSFIGISKLSAQDSLVFYSELKFHSDLEKEAFEKYFIHNNEDYLTLLLASSPSVNHQDLKLFLQNYEAIGNKVSPKKVEKRSRSRQVSKVHNNLHNYFLNKYDAENSMHELFTNGSYNCVTSSALYALLFEDLGIPYVIKEKPKHVYVVALPGTENILVETTDVSGGAFDFDDKFKKDYVQQIIIDNALPELNTKSYNELFNEHFFIGKDISLEELIGVQYLNEGLYLLHADKKEKAIWLFEKACFFYRDNKINNMLLVMYLDVLKSNNYEKIGLIDNLIKVSRFKENDLTQQIVLSEFGRISQVHLFNQKDTSAFEQFYNKLVTGIDDKVLKKKVTYLYSFERGRAHYNASEYAKALKFFESAYQLEPNNENIERLFVNTLALKLNADNNPEKAYSELERYKIQFPILINDIMFKSLLVNNYLLQFAMAFDDGNEGRGIRYKSLFEEYFEEGLMIPESNLGRAYSLAAVYYFKKGHSSKSRVILNEGLKYDPDNHELLTRKRLIAK